MDYRLDLFNAIRNYQENMTDEDALFIICHNSKDGDLFAGLDGNQEIISSVLSTEDYVKLQGVEDVDKFEKMKGMMLNIAVNILRTDGEKRKKFCSIIEGFNEVEITPYMGVKLSVIRKDGAITTWHDMGKPIEKIVTDVKEKKNWIGGKFEWIRLDWTENGKYNEKFIDHEKFNYLLSK